MNQNILGHPMVTLTNGLRVVNHSSPHSFEFTDGSVLPKCVPELSYGLQLANKDREYDLFTKNKVMFKCVKKHFVMTDAIISDLKMLHNHYRENRFDICLVALPTMQAFKEWFDNLNNHHDYYDDFFSWMYCIYVQDRVKKIISIERFTQ